MSRFYIPKDRIKGPDVTIEGDEAHHVASVMRLGEGDSVVVFDGEGNEYKAAIKTVDARRKSVTLNIVSASTFSSESPNRITLAQAIPKKGKMDLVVEKATELGVFRVIPMTTERTIVKPGAGASLKMAKRWKKITVEASKQCGRTVVPEVADITRFRTVAASAAEYDIALMACLAEGVVPLKDIIAGSLPEKILVLIGPEGDFTPKEVEMARAYGFGLVSLGPRVLKSDTAGLFVLSVLDHKGN